MSPFRCAFISAWQGAATPTILVTLAADHANILQTFNLGVEDTAEIAEIKCMPKIAEIRVSRSMQKWPYTKVFR